MNTPKQTKDRSSPFEWCVVRRRAVQRRLVQRRVVRAPVAGAASLIAGPHREGPERGLREKVMTDGQSVNAT
ncbi:hypothetical protein GCM10010372_52300 [Streptomyces tauricus]|nr:hypothetical protein GCM10010372_52300 [Streptomyces tauricus]